MTSQKTQDDSYTNPDRQPRGYSPLKGCAAKRAGSQPDRQPPLPTPPTYPGGNPEQDPDYNASEIPSRDPVEMPPPPKIV